MTHSPTFTAVEPHPHPRFAAYMHIDVLLEESVKTTFSKAYWQKEDPKGDPSKITTLFCAGGIAAEPLTEPAEQGQ
jgi:hypothetical protein